MRSDPTRPPMQEPNRYPVDPRLMCELIREVFAGGGVFRFYPTGVSMLPMLREHRDSVLLVDPSVRPVRKRDVILYQRADGQVVLHRVIGRDKLGNLTLCGDHQTVPERGIRPEQVLGVLTEFTRGERRISVRSRRYRLYAAFWVAIRPIRRVICGGWRRIRRIFG